MIQFSAVRFQGAHQPVLFARESVARPILSPLQADTVTFRKADAVRFGKDLTPKPDMHLRHIVVESPALAEIKSPARREEAAKALQTMGRILKELTGGFYTEWIRQFNDAKRQFETVVAQDAWGQTGFDPKQAYKRIGHGKAHPIAFNITLSHPNLLENRNLRSIDLGGVTLASIDGKPLSLREAKFELANLYDFHTPKGSDFRDASYDHETVFTPRTRLQKQMTLSNPRYETGPWAAYTNLFTEWPRSLAQRWMRSHALKHQPPKRWNLPGLP